MHAAHSTDREARKEEELGEAARLREERDPGRRRGRRGKEL